MAKELPYFKFFVSEWNDGDITLESFHIQGLFINVCSYYWSKECDLDLETLNKKFRHNVKDIQELIETDLVKITNDKISIDFLDEQQQERGKLSKQNSVNAKKMWAKKKASKGSQAVASNSHTSSHYGNDAIKRREEKKREDNTIGKFLDWFNSCKKNHTGVAGKFKTLTSTDENNLKKLKESYSGSDFELAIPNLFKNKWAKDNNCLTPSHFLRVENFNKYLNQQTSAERKDYEW